MEQNANGKTVKNLLTNISDFVSEIDRDAGEEIKAKILAVYSNAEATEEERLAMLQSLMPTIAKQLSKASERLSEGKDIAAVFTASRVVTSVFQLLLALMSKEQGSEPYTPDGVAQALEQDRLNLEAVKMLAGDPTFTKSFEALTAAINAITERKQQYEDAATFTNNIELIQPFIDAEIEKPEYGGLSYTELLEEADIPEERERIAVYDLFDADKTAETAYIRESRIGHALLAAYAAFLKSNEPKNYQLQPVKNYLYPLDKVNKEVWGYFAKDVGDQVNGQINFEIDLTNKHGKRKRDVSATALYSINFSSIEGIDFLKKLTYFDKLVYIVVGALYKEGNRVVSPGEIYRLMGYQSAPSDKEIQKILTSIKKMSGAQIMLDNKREADTYPNRHYFKYTGPLLPATVREEYTKVNGQLIRSAIHILEEPPLIHFARERNQITQIDKRIIAIPLSKTETNLAIWDYLVDRISHMKSKNFTTDRKIKFDTLCEKCGISGRQKERVPAKVIKHLDYFKSDAANRFIGGYTIQTTGKKGIKISVTIYLPGEAIPKS